MMYMNAQYSGLSWTVGVDSGHRKVGDDDVWHSLTHALQCGRTAHGGENFKALTS
jgi:hypothetical protein